MADDGPLDAPVGAGRAAWLLLAMAMVLSAALAWAGGPLGSAGAGAATSLAVLAAMRLPSRRGGPSREPAGRHTPLPEVAGRVGAEVMVSQVVPVWSRQMDSTRDAVNQGLATLLESFSEMSGTLAALSDNLQSANPTAAPGSITNAVESQSPALAALLAPSERAFRQRDEAVAVLAACGESLGELQHQAKQAREIARHTRLVAFNASIEAQRGHQGSDGRSNGSQAVANELRDLASRMAAAGETIDRLVLKLGQQVSTARQRGETHDTTPDELRLELDIQAREALTLLVGSLGAALQGTAAMRDLSSSLQQRLEDTFVNFQFGDRVSQMLSIVGNDMIDFAHWVAANPHATQTDAAQWLEALEASYTMDEQRAQHHGNVHVDRGSEIEFF